MNVRLLQWLLVAGCIISAAAAFIGAEPLWDRLCYVTGTVICGLGAWGIHERKRVVWRLGRIILVLSAIPFVVQAAIALLPEPNGWVGVMGAVFGAAVATSAWDKKDETWWRTTTVLFFASSTLAYVLCATSVYRGLEAGRPTLQNPHPAHITGFPAWIAFVTALVPAFVAGTVTFVIRILFHTIREKVIRRT